jgi:hypothetical protein
LEKEKEKRKIECNTWKKQNSKEGNFVD